MIARLRERFPNIVSPKSDDICYATTNRQLAVKQLAAECDLVLVIGSRNSSNSNRLVDVTRELGTASHLIDSADEVEEEWLEGVETVGITSGASAPEELVSELVELFRRRGTEEVSELRAIDEAVRFMLPKQIRVDLAAAERRAERPARSRAQRSGPGAKASDQTLTSPSMSRRTSCIPCSGWPLSS